MSRPDTAASAALDGDVKPIWLIYLDFLGNPLRGCTAGMDLTITGSTDPDLEGHTFEGINSQLLDVTDISTGEGGTDTVTIRVSGIPDLDDDAINDINNPAIYQGRTARLWRIIRNGDSEQMGGIQPYYTGYMVGGMIDSQPDEQVIEIQVEGYISAHSAPSMRTYLDQELYDAGDLSARAAIAIANGVGGDPAIRPQGFAGIVDRWTELRGDPRSAWEGWRGF